MLYILTGYIQTGKTRWLQSLIEELERNEVTCEGVLAPGVWQSNEDGSFTKLGIENELIPGHARIPFAVRGDLAVSDGTFDCTAQSAKAQLKWHISDDALDKVNAHLGQLIGIARDDAAQSTRTADNAGARVLVLDELGPLELLKNGGLTNAVDMLKHGGYGRYDLAIATVRDKFDLPALAMELLAPHWNAAALVGPTDETKREILDSLNRRAVR